MYNIPNKHSFVCIPNRSYVTHTQKKTNSIRNVIFTRMNEKKEKRIKLLIIVTSHDTQFIGEKERIRIPVVLYVCIIHEFPL